MYNISSSKSRTFQDEERQTLKSNTSSSSSYKAFPRLIHRNEPFHQSKNRVAIKNRTHGRLRQLFPFEVLFMAKENWFHMFLRWRFIYSATLLMVFWFITMILFACLYVYADSIEPDRRCGLGEAGDPISFYPALAFSMETSTTVGYSLPNNSNGVFEPECRLIQAAVYLQMAWSLLFNATLTAIIFARLSRCEQRSVQVMFSDKAIIHKKDGRWLFTARFYDLDSRLPIVEAHVRMYCASWNDYNVPSRQNAGQPHLLHTMRIEEPNDELNGMVFTGVPMNATHAIDPFSPLAPRYMREDLNLMKGHGLILRQADMLAGSLGAMPCPVCGETYETPEQLKAHIEYTKIIEEYSDPVVPIKGTHRDPDLITPRLTKKFEITKEIIMETLKDKEILVVLEGIEPMHSGTFQALHSYKLEDIAFNARFAPCISRTEKSTYVDLDEFHKVYPIHDDVDSEYDTFKY